MKSDNAWGVFISGKHKYYREGSIHNIAITGDRWILVVSSSHLFLVTTSWWAESMTSYKHIDIRIDIRTH
jgi:hypothetical protein